MDAMSPLIDPASAASLHAAGLLMTAAGLLTHGKRLHGCAAIGAFAGSAGAVLGSAEALFAFVWLALLAGAIVKLWPARVRPDTIAFNREEEAVLQHALAAIPRERARHLLDQGFWLSARPGETLVREGDAAHYILCLGTGKAALLRDGRTVGRCDAGGLIGDAHLRRNETTAVVESRARIWCVPAAVLGPRLALAGRTSAGETLSDRP